MKRLAAFLLLLVAVTHYGYDLIALQYEQPEKAARAWFYILRGIEGAALFAVLATLLRRNLPVVVVCLWGMAEEAQTSICRLSKPTTESPRNELFSGLCGSEWYWAGVIAASVIGSALLDRLGRKQ